MKTNINSVCVFYDSDGRQAFSNVGYTATVTEKQRKLVIKFINNFCKQVEVMNKKLQKLEEN